jgi:hypothetical protein
MHETAKPQQDAAEDLAHSAADNSAEGDDGTPAATQFEEDGAHGNNDEERELNDLLQNEVDMEGIYGESDGESDGENDDDGSEPSPKRARKGAADSGAHSTRERQTRDVREPTSKETKTDAPNDSKRRQAVAGFRGKHVGAGETALGRPAALGFLCAARKKKRKESTLLHTSAVPRISPPIAVSDVGERPTKKAREDP